VADAAGAAAAGWHGSSLVVSSPPKSALHGQQKEEGRRWLASLDEFAFVRWRGNEEKRDSLNIVQTDEVEKGRSDIQTSSHPLDHAQRSIDFLRWPFSVWAHSATT